MGPLIIALLLMATGPSYISAYSGCGRPSIPNRIVGGQDSVQGEFPWQLSLRKNGMHICGGSLIDSQWVVSAAHCFAKPFSVTDFKVNLGAYQLSVPSGILADVAAIYIHPTFTRIGNSGDIALIKLANPVQFTDLIMPVCIPTPTVVFPNGINCTVTGWGSVRQLVSLQYPRTLQKVHVPIIDRMSCDQMYHTDNPSLAASQNLIMWDMICAGYKAGGRDACQGDSGGPLVCPWNGSWILAGIVSWGFGCALPNRPGVYTSVTTYSAWIQQYIPGFQLTQAQIPPPNYSGSLASSLEILIFSLVLHKLLG
ncbi:hypothetical protein XELAEV_18047895mg [Xenopus laevis]|uniref:Peptidase S1 domain-containing protein n=1 Tax=Xenopus laevis TaxID=8355 RepID=A0A974BW59_XENLA|nr:hypothetical protein XELAEV_18047895mg [Xenopus laevis]